MKKVLETVVENQGKHFYYQVLIMKRIENSSDSF